MSDTSDRIALPHRYSKIKENKIKEDKMNENINKWNKELLENLLPQFVLYEPECHNLKECIDNIAKAYEIIMHFIVNGKDVNNSYNRNFLLNPSDKQNNIYIELRTNYMKLLRTNAKYKMDNCKNKFKFLDGITDIRKIINLSSNLITNSAYLIASNPDISHIDRKPPIITGQRLMTDYFKSKPKSSPISKSK